MSKRMVRQCVAGAFTLIELLLVLVILTALAAIVVPKFTARGKEAKITQAKTQIAAFETAIGMYEVATGQFPTTDQGLNALNEAPAGVTGWKGPYMSKGIPNDPWGNPYVYVCPGVHNPNEYDIHSFGPDGQDGTEDDIDNWSQH